MRMVVAEIPLSAQPMETARWLIEGALHADLWADVDRGRVVGSLEHVPQGERQRQRVASAKVRLYCTKSGSPAWMVSPWRETAQRLRPLRTWGCTETMLSA